MHKIHGTVGLHLKWNENPLWEFCTAQALRLRSKIAAPILQPLLAVGAHTPGLSVRPKNGGSWRGTPLEPAKRREEEGRGCNVQPENLAMPWERPRPCGLRPVHSPLAEPASSSSACSPGRREAVRRHRGLRTKVRSAGSQCRLPEAPPHAHAHCSRPQAAARPEPEPKLGRWAPP